jgi:hypothetical protein
MRVRHQKFGKSGVNKNSAEDQAADPDDCAAGVQWAGLHHDIGFLAKLHYF